MSTGSVGKRLMEMMWIDIKAMIRELELWFSGTNTLSARLPVDGGKCQSGWPTTTRYEVTCVAEDASNASYKFDVIHVKSRPYNVDNVSYDRIAVTSLPSVVTKAADQKLKITYTFSLEAPSVYEW